MASLSQMELAAAILDIVPQMDPQVVTLSIVMDMLATHFGVDLDDIKRHRAVIKTLVVSGIQAYHGTENEKSGSGNGDDEDDGDKENVDRSPPRQQKKKRRVQENPKRRPARRSNVISDGSDDESEQEEEEGDNDGDENHESESQQSGSDSDEAPSKKRVRGKATPAKRKAASSSKLDKSANKKAAPAAKKPPRQSDPPGLASLKEMARSARLLSPRIYTALKKLDSESEQEEYIRGLLCDNGIAFSGRYPQKREIDAVRRKKDMEKDLEGIDTSLIIPDDTTSRSRRASRAQVSYAEQLRNRAASEDEEENDDGDAVDENTEKKSEDDDEFAASDSSEAEF
uniref:DEK C-terminal domain-containing protein n=1 Tax=Globisporangium ultimum (strain ATCC 200006 / CBS 805.95 / DAOM BR144) TaxID=431595 RepID=K3W7A7_GLOUD